MFERLKSPESNSLSGLILCLHDFEGFLHLANNALGKEFCIMLGDASGTVAQHFRHHLQPNSSVQTSGRIGVSGHMGENGFIDTTDVTNRL